MKLARMIITASAVLAIGLAAGCKKDEKSDAPAADPAAKPDPSAAGTPTAPTGDQAAPTPAADPAPAAPMGGSVDELGAKTITMMEAMAKAAAANKGDCDKQAAALQTIVDSNKDLMAAGKAADKDPAKKKEFEDKFGDKGMAIMGGMMGDLAACQDNENLKKVFDSFE
jgi:hypothetical protein